METKKMIQLAQASSYKAIDVRRSIAADMHVMQALTPVQQDIFTASTKKPISEIPQEELAMNIAKLVKLVARDAGIKNVDSYDVTRFMSILTRYYSDLTLSEIKLAFELAMVGELDEFLPKDKNGNADRSHYQSFSVEYISKILNAYRRKKGEVQAVAYDMMQGRAQLAAPDKGEKEKTEKKIKENAIYVYLHYKYLGRYPADTTEIQLMLIYNLLADAGFTPDLRVTEADRRLAYTHILARIARGTVNTYTAIHIRRQGIEHDEVKASARWVAMLNTLRETFEQMINDEIQICEL